MKLKGRAFSYIRYLTGNTPWESDEPRPTVMAFIAEMGMPPGNVIDLGCGTGSTLIGMAKQGWRGIGVDHVQKPLRRARRKARQAGVSDRIRFIRGDVRRLDKLRLEASYEMALDLGCGHALGDESFIPYLSDVSRLVREGGWLILFAYLPSPQRTTAYLARDFVLREASRYFTLIRWEEDERRGKPTCWYFFTRNAQTGGTS